MITQAIARYIERHHLLRKEGIHLVALSGGADSVALLLVLRELGYRLHAIHCNFHLRGKEADRDERFCIDLCQKLDIPLHLAHFDTLTYAQAHRVSIEMAARELRYRHFARLRKDIGALDICVAHHKDDQAETMLMNLVRGTGTRGLTGMAPRNGDIVRPMLAVNRREIEEYLREKGQDYVTDSSNLVDDVTRNKIRLKVMPLLRDINPAAIEHMARTAEYVADERDFAEEEAMKSLRQIGAEKGRIDLRLLLQKKGHNYLIFLYLSRYGFNSAQISEILSSIDSQGRSWSSGSHECTIDRGYLLVAPKRAATKPFRIPEPGRYHLTACWNFHVTDRTPDFKPSKDKRHATMDADKVRFPLTLRSTRPGDRFTPYGMRGNKLVSDYLTDRKRDIFQKRDQMVVTDADGHIIWLVGERVAQQCAVTDTTTRVLHVEWTNLMPPEQDGREKESARDENLMA